MPERTRQDLQDPGAGGSPEDIGQTGKSSDDLLSYKRTELGCVTDLRRLLDFALKIDLNRPILQLTEDVLKRAENKCFSIAVVGEFKRGKSTFINALLGREVLPADIRPCSATLNRVTYGLRPSVTLYFRSENGEPRRVEEIGIDELEKYVTKLTPESRNTSAQIEEAVVHFPTEYCHNNVDIIDTPGLNDDETMTAVTMSVIPKVDAAILVIMPESPFSGYEGDFLTKHLLLQDLGRVMFVVNAIDRLRKPKDREAIVTVIQERIALSVETRLKEQFEPESEEFKRYRQQIGTPKVFPLSAYMALEAQEQHNPEQLKESRFTEFTSALEQFLTHTRGAIELQVLANRILATSDEIVKKINIEIGALNMGQQEFQTAYEASLAQLDNLRRRRDQEIAKIEAAAAQTAARLEPITARIGDDLKKAAMDVIDNSQVTGDDLTKAKLPELTERLSRQVSEAVKLRGLRHGETLQREVESDLESELERLYDFAKAVGTTLSGIEGQFGTVQVDPSAQSSIGSESFAAALSVFTGFGGIWSGYREAGVKGGAVGGIISLGTCVAGGILAAALSIPVTLPIVLGLGIVSIFTGGWTVKRLFSADRVERFKEKYRGAIQERIDEELHKRDLESTVKKNIQGVYAAVKDKLMGEVTASIEQTQSTLDDLRNRKARDEALTEHKRQSSEQTRGEVLGIRAKALRLSNQLAEVANV
jgi:GTPase Era involved in 16S rRNA processing